MPSSRSPVVSRARAIPRALALSLAALVGFSFVPAAQVEAAAPLDQLAVSVVGDGSTTGNNAVPVSIHLLDGAGDLGATIALPTSASGGQLPFALGADRDQQGALQQSADARFVTLGGYAAEPGAGSLNDTIAPALPRVVARIAANGEVDTTTTLGGAYSLRHIRGVVTDDGSNYWTGGHGGDSLAPAGGVLTVPAGPNNTPTAIVAGSSALNNARVVDIHDGQLYATSDRSGFSGLNMVGTGTPLTASALTLVAPAPANATVAHDFAFAGDSLYVGFTEGSARGIAKYERSGGQWLYVDTLQGDFWGLEARVAGDGTVLYAIRGAGQANELVRIVDSGDTSSFVAQTDVLSTAPLGTAYRGVAFAPGFVSGTDAVDPILPKPIVAWDSRVAGGSGAALGAVLDAANNPSARGKIEDPAAQSFTVTVASSNEAVVPDSGVDFRLHADGTFTLSAEPVSTGSAIITVTVVADDGRTTTASLAYRVAPAFADTSVVPHFGMSDASAAISVGEGFFIAADDDSNALRLFSPEGGEALAEFDFSDQIEFERAGEAHDFEAVAQVGNQVYWIGSTGNTRSGNVRLDRNIVLQTELSGIGAAATLEFVGYQKVLREALVAWDRNDEHGLGADHFGFFNATQPGVSAEGPDSLNIEGAAIAPDGTTLWLGFRSPEVGEDANALIVPVENIAEVIAGAPATLGDPILLDLGGRAIREMARAETGEYLIVAGSADDSGRFALFGWTGNIDDAPVQAAGTLGLENWPGSYEGVVGVTSLADGTSVRLLLDSGTVDIYGDGTAGQDLSAPEHKLFPSQAVTLNFGAVFTPKTVEVAGNALRIGTPTAVTAQGFAAGEAVVFELRSAEGSVVLGNGAANAEGTVSTTLTVEDSVALGAYTLAAIGNSGTGTSEITVLERGATLPGEETPGEETPGEETPGEETPGEENPGESALPNPSEPSTAPGENAGGAPSAGSPGAIEHGSVTAPLPVTGVDPVGTVVASLALLMLGLGSVVAARRRNTRDSDL